MQERKPDEKLSRLRVTLLALLEHLREVLNVALARTPLVKGNVYEIARRCGTPNCICTRGRLHRNMVLSWSEQGRSHMRSIPRARMPSCLTRVQNICAFVGPAPRSRC